LFISVRPVAASGSEFVFEFMTLALARTPNTSTVELEKCRQFDDAGKWDNLWKEYTLKQYIGISPWIFYSFKHLPSTPHGCVAPCFFFLALCCW